MENSLIDKSYKTDLEKKNRKKGMRRISEVMPIYTQMNKLNLKGKNEIENLLINNQESISYNNINILKSDLPNMLNNFNQIKEGNNIRIPTGKSVDRKNYSRNFDYFNQSLGDGKLDIDKFNTTMQLRKISQNKKIDNTSNSPNISQFVWQKSKIMGFVGSSKNKNSRNNDNLDINNKNKRNFLTHINNNINTFTTKNNNEKLKFTVNKKNILNTIKKPAKIKIEKKNFKYKIPIELMNNLGNKKKVQGDRIGETAINRKLNLKLRNNNNRSASTSNNKKNKINYNNSKNYIENNDNNSKSFIESTLLAFNGLVSQAQQIGQILIDNKEIINDNKENELVSNQLKNSIEILNMDKKIDKLDNKIRNEHKTIEELQKINLDLNNKINLFNKNSQQYKNKVKELSDVINQLKQNNNNITNNNSEKSIRDNISSSLINQNHNVPINYSGNKYIPSNQNNSFTLEGIPKKKKMKFGFVERIFMKDDKFQYINNQKPKININIDKSNKEQKLIIVNMNKGNEAEDNKNKIITKEEYEDAAEQIANQLLIESLFSLNENENL